MIISCHNARAKTSNCQNGSDCFLFVFFLSTDSNESAKPANCCNSVVSSISPSCFLKLWRCDSSKEMLQLLQLDINPKKRVKVPINKRGNGAQSLFRAAASLQLSEQPVSVKNWDNHPSMYSFIYSFLPWKNVKVTLLGNAEKWGNNF